MNIDLILAEPAAQKALSQLQDIYESLLIERDIMSYSLSSVLCSSVCHLLKMLAADAELSKRCPEAELFEERFAFQIITASALFRHY